MSPKRYGFALACIALALAWTQASAAAPKAPPAEGAKKLRVLLLTGLNNHDWRTTTPAIQALLEDSGRFTVELTDRPDQITAEKLRGFDVILSNWNNWRKRSSTVDAQPWSDAMRKAYLEFVRNGGGHVIVHAGSSSFFDWQEYHKLVLTTWNLGKTGHGPKHEFPVRIDDPTHPVTAGLGEFKTFDELWNRAGVQENAKVIASALSAKDKRGTGQWEPIAFAAPYGKGRSFSLLLGHDVRAMNNAGFKELLVRGTAWAATKTSAATWAWDEQAGKSVSLKRGQQVVWQFNYAADQNKAYFHPVALPGGPVLTWDKPPDHVWHHALWFSWKFLNGVNYWETDRKTGKPAGRTQWANVKVATRPDHTARITMDMTWRDPDDKAVLTGTRTVDVSAPDETGRYHFDWTCTFTAGKKDVVLDRTPLPGEPGGKGYGGYAGLSLRLAKQLTGRKATTPAGPVKFKQVSYRGKAPAMDYNGTIGGKPVGIAICDHPDNLNHPTPWYAIASKKMSYFSPAVICYKPHTIPAGKTLTLRYRVIVHTDRWDAKKLDTETKRFATDSAASETKRSTP